MNGTDGLAAQSLSMELLVCGTGQAGGSGSGVC